MILWCAYCQTFMGEKEPYNQFDVSHGICVKCKQDQKHRKLTDEDKLKIHLLKDYGLQLYKAGQVGDLKMASILINKGIELGVQPLETLIGFMTPLLYEIGDQWSKGTVTVSDEHRFTAFCEKILELIDQKQTINEEAQLVRPDFLLVNADGNYHTLGIRTLAHWLNAVKISTFLVYPSLPNREILMLIRSLRPLYLGISLSMAHQISGFLELYELLKTLDVNLRPDIFVGGYLVKSNSSILPVLDNVYYCSHLSDLKYQLSNVGKIAA